MARPEKVQTVSDIKERLEAANAIFVTEYRGLNVSQAQVLRRGLRAAEAEYKIYKMTLARLAAADAGLDQLTPLLDGPVAIAFVGGDPVPAAKALKDFSNDHPALVLKGGLLAGEILEPDRLRKLADIEPREVLLAKLAGAMKAPLTKTAGLLGAVLRGPATAMSQLLDKKRALEEADAPEPPPPEPEASTEPEASEPESSDAVEEPEASAEPESTDDSDQDDETAADAAKEE